MWRVVLLALASLTLALIPKPKQQTFGPEVYALERPLEIHQGEQECFLIRDGIKRFAQRLRRTVVSVNDSRTPASYIKALEIKITVPCRELHIPMWPSARMNETYSVYVTSDLIRINAEEIWGALHGLETVIQLFHRNKRNEIVIFQQTIVDEPRFPHRGYLIDTSRHFLSVPSIMRFIDAMAMVKMNVLHWHIVDTESFPYQSIKFPLLADKGAYDPLVLVYTHNDVLEVVNYARQRGIRVMPEFDTPGHSESWGLGYPHLLTECFNTSETSVANFNKRYGPMNPTIRYTYDFLLSFFEEVISVFPDEWIHLGGDEVDFGCWKSNPDIRKFMEEKHFGNDYSKLQSYFTVQLLELVQYAKSEKRSVTPVMWQEVFDNGFDVHKETVIHVWKEDDWTTEMKNITRAGYDVLFSSCWYLNIISYGITWPKYYECDPSNFGGTVEEVKRVRGGEATMWGEHVDETNLFSRSWPNGAAVAERLWSTGNLSHTDFAPRLNELRCQMLLRGWNAEPANGQGFCPE